MTLSDLSVKRPVMAVVFSLLLIAFGVLSFAKLPLREYPDTSPPVVSVVTSYPGASSEVVESKITRIVEDRISGIEGINYIESASRNGRSEITIEFVVGRDIDAAANDVRDRVSRLSSILPEEADPPEISKVDANSDVVIWLALSSTIMNGLELTDYAQRYLVDRFSTLEGVAQVRLGGARKYAMRIWLDRKALAARGLTVDDVENTLRRENVELPAGRVESVEREFVVRIVRTYRQPGDFNQMVLKRGEGGSLVRLGEVARVELGAEDERSELRGNGIPMVGIGVIKQSTANTLAVARGVKDEIPKIEPTLPKGMTLKVRYDTSLFIEEAIHEVYLTLGVTIVLVILVIYAFLGSLRATIIPAVTVPISLVATFMLLLLCGFSINLLTLLALVLAIGLVVDDAIIVLENVYRRVEEGENPLLAAIRGSRQVGFAVIATSLVLIAVFLPIAFLEGNIGRLFREFALAMAGAVAFSMIIALTLTPMMCSKLLKHEKRQSKVSQFINNSYGKLFAFYDRLLLSSFNHKKRVWIMVAAIIGAMLLLFYHLPREYAPREDRGMFFVSLTGPEGATFENTQNFMRKAESILMPLVEKGEAAGILSRVPLSFNSTGTVNGGMAIVVLSPWSERARKSKDIVAEITPKLSAIPGVKAFPSLPQGLGQRGTARPIQFVVGGGTYEELAKWRDVLMDEITKFPGIQGPDVDYKETKPQLDIVIDQNRAADLGVSVEAVGRTLETMLGGRRVTTYPDRGEEYDVLVQGQRENYRSPFDINNIYVRSERSGQLIPLSNLITMQERADSEALNRYNRLRSITLSANVAPGYTLGECLDFLQKVVKEKLPSHAHVDYKGESREFQRAGADTVFIFILALLVIYLILAAQFESFLHPVLIMLAVPLALFGALLGLQFFGQSMNVYSQIGMVMLVGLAAKNGILIVEFANQLRDEGKPFDDAILESVRLFLCPILMTSFTAVMGALPLLLASGAGEESRFVLGVVIFFGVLCTTLLTVIVVPVAYQALARKTGSPEAVAHELQRLEEKDASH